MVRCRNTVQVKYGYYREFYDCVVELNEMLKKHDMKAWTVFMPMAGVDNTVVSEVDYDSLAAMESEQEKFFSDADMMKTFRKASEYVVQGSSTSEVLMEAMQIA